MFSLDIRKEHLHQESGQALEQPAQGSGGISIPVCVHKPCGQGPYWHGLVVALAVLG